MNQGRIWCVVNPTVGLPLFLGSVAGISLVVHACLMTQTNWFSFYWNGSFKEPPNSNRHVSENVTPAPAAIVKPQGSPAFAITVAPVPPAPGKTETAFVITVTPSPGSPQTAQTITTPPIGRTEASTLALAKPPPER